MSAKRPGRNSEKQRMFYVGFCRVCGTGPLGLRSCGACSAVVILCDECDAMWTDADLNAEPSSSGEGDSLCPLCDGSLIATPSRWATEKDLESVDWLQHALQQRSLQLRRGAPFAIDIRPSKDDDEA